MLIVVYFHCSNVAFELKSDTDLYEFAKAKTYPTSICISPDGSLFVTMSMDRQVRVFKLSSGKLHRKYDESIQVAQEMQQAGTAVVKLDDMDFQRRIALEREIEKSDQYARCNAIFDDTSNFILYPTLLGVKGIFFFFSLFLIACCLQCSISRPTGSSAS